MEETPKEERGDLIGDREPSKEETSPAEDIETKQSLGSDDLKEQEETEK